MPDVNTLFLTFVQLVVEGPTWVHFCEILLRQFTDCEDDVPNGISKLEYDNRRMRPLKEYLKSIWCTLVLDHITGIPSYKAFVALKNSFLDKSDTSLVNELVNKSLLMTWKPFQRGQKLQAHRTVTTL